MANFNLDISNKNMEKPGQKLKEYCWELGFKSESELADAAAPVISKSYINKLFKTKDIYKPGCQKIPKLLTVLSEKSGFSIDEIWNKIFDIYQQSDFPFNENQRGFVNNFINSPSASSSITERQQDNNIKHNFTRRPQEIFGRQKELEQLLNDFFLQEGKIVTISGMGGIGKTALALSSAYSCLESENEASKAKFEAIIFTSAKNKTLRNSTKVLPINTPDVNLTDILDKISRTLEEENINRENDLKNQCQLAYEALKKYRTLLIVDNLETIEDQDDLLGFLYNVPSTVTVLITTRDSSGLIANIRLEPLEPEYSLKIIQRQIDLLNRDKREFNLNDDQKDQLQKAADGIPIVIEYCIGLLAEGYRFQDILDILEHSDGVLANFLFQEAVKQLEDNISYKLLMAMSILCKPFRRDAIVAISGLDTITDTDLDISHGFVQLRRLSLIRSEANEKYSMSSLTHDYAHAHLKQNREFEAQAIKRWVQYYIELSQDNGRKNLYDWERGNWSQRFDVLEEQWENLEAVIEFCVRQELYDEFKSLWISLNNYTEVYGKWAAHFRWLKILMEQAKHNFDDQTIVFAKSAIARVHIREGSNDNLSDAEQLLEEAQNLESFADLPVKVELFENQIMLNIERQEFEQARIELQLLEEFLQSQDLSDENRIRYNLPFKYRLSQVLASTGELDMAKTMYRETIRDAKEIRWILAVIGPQNRLADLLIEENKLEEAKKLLDSTLAATEKNKYYRRTAYCHASLGRLHHRREEILQAKEHYKTALDIFKRLGMRIQQQRVDECLLNLIN